MFSGLSRGLARQKEAKVKRLETDKQSKIQMWQSWESDLKKTYLQEKKRHAANLGSLDKEILEARLIQDQARAILREMAISEKETAVRKSSLRSVARGYPKPLRFNNPGCRRSGCLVQGPRSCNWSPYSAKHSPATHSPSYHVSGTADSHNCYEPCVCAYFLPGKIIPCKYMQTLGVLRLLLLQILTWVPSLQCRSQRGCSFPLHSRRARFHPVQRDLQVQFSLQASHKICHPR